MIQIQTSRSQDCLPPPTTQTTQAKQLAPLLPQHHHFSTAPSTHPGHQEEHMIPLILVAITSNAFSQHQHPAPPK